LTTRRIDSGSAHSFASIFIGRRTYTGIEAVSNSMPVMREPKVKTGKRTMLLMAISLSLTAGGWFSLI